MLGQGRFPGITKVLAGRCTPQTPALIQDSILRLACGGALPTPAQGFCVKETLAQLRCCSQKHI